MLHDDHLNFHYYILLSSKKIQFILMIINLFCFNYNFCKSSVIYLEMKNCFFFVVKFSSRDKNSLMVYILHGPLIRLFNQNIGNLIMNDCCIKLFFINMSITLRYLHDYHVFVIF